MKDFNSLSGPWIGFSIQDRIRISERMVLLIVNGTVSGSGTDKDGKFQVGGNYHSESGRLTLTRRYTWTTEPSQLGVGIPYEYEGKWDGEFAFGMWHPRHEAGYGGEFEMWPDQEEDRSTETIGIEHRQPLALTR